MMTVLGNGFVGLVPTESLAWQGRIKYAVNGDGHHGQNGHASHPRAPDPECLRRCAWDIGAARAADAYQPAANHVGLAAVAPYHGFAHWRILQDWVDRTAWDKGQGWHDCRLILRLYDVSHIDFNGFNAHHMQDHMLPGLCGQSFFKLPRPGTWELAEVGFRLRSGEFVPAARSQAVPFAPSASSSRGDNAALLVAAPGRVEEVANLWDQERILRERRSPSLRVPLRTAAFAFASLGSGHEGWLATFVSELATGQCAQGHEAHVFVPASASFNTDRQIAGVHYHPLEVSLEGTALDQARAFGQAAEKRLQGLPPFDLIHVHEWLAGAVPCRGARPAILSLSSIEVTRRNGTPPEELSLEIEKAERRVANAAACVLTPAWLRDRAVAELGIDDGRVRAFPMEGRMPNDWEAPLDFGQVKMGIGVGPLDRLLLFVGPLEHAAGVDLLLEALPVLLNRAPNLRLAYVGAGNLFGSLQCRIHELSVAHAVRLLGHVQGPLLTRLVRSAEAVVLPSRYRVPFDDAVVDLARRAGRPVVTTHGGPAHLVRHEENGIVTYDNPGSMVWAVDRILGDPGHAERMGHAGRQSGGGGIVWSDVARHYLEVCASYFPELTVTRW
jgi:glycosyltransferase involved in cell wall biosynthesis